MVLLHLVFVHALHTQEDHRVLKGEEPSTHELHVKMTGQMWPKDLHGKEEKQDPETPKVLLASGET